METCKVLPYKTEDRSIVYYISNDKFDDDTRYLHADLKFHKYCGFENCFKTTEEAQKVVHAYYASAYYAQSDEDPMVNEYATAMSILYDLFSKPAVDVPPELMAKLNMTLHEAILESS